MPRYKGDYHQPNDGLVRMYKDRSGAIPYFPKLRGAILSRKEQRATYYRWRKTGDPALRHRLIESIIPYAIHQAAKYGAALNADLYSEALLACCEAVDRWRPRKGCLTTYATWWIMNKTLRYRAKDSPIRVPLYIYHGQGNEQNHMLAMRARYGTIPIINVDKYRWQEDDGLAQVDRDDHDGYLLEKAYECIAMLTPREQAIVQGHALRKTYKTMAEEHGVSRERVRQILERCLRMIRVHVNRSLRQRA